MHPSVKFVIIVAGGSGKRMKNSVPKQFMELAGKPILMHTISRFLEYDPSIQCILVLPKEHHDFWNALVKKHQFNANLLLVEGGSERFYSVQNGLQKITSNAIVAIHDGVRPLVSIDTITRCFDAAVEKGAVVPVVPATDSIRKVEKGKSIAVDRTLYFMVQTPQVFLSEHILKAYQLGFDPAFTDDASVVEKAGIEVHCVDGNVENIKITRPIDLQIAEVLLHQ